MVSSDNRGRELVSPVKRGRGMEISDKGGHVVVSSDIKEDVG